MRVKDVDEHELARLAEPLQRICADADVAFIVNDSMALAKRLGADGVHLGQSDGDIREARALLGPAAQIGKTCHDSRHLAMEAGEAGADYVAFGAFYPTTTKPSHYRPHAVDPQLVVVDLRNPVRRDRRDHARQCQPLVDAGADFIAVCQAVWGKDDPGAAVRAFEEVLRESSSRSGKHPSLRIVQPEPVASGESVLRSSSRGCSRPSLRRSQSLAQTAQGRVPADGWRAKAAQGLGAAGHAGIADRRRDFPCARCCSMPPVSRPA